MFNIISLTMKYFLLQQLFFFKKAIGNFVLFPLYSR